MSKKKLKRWLSDCFVPLKRKWVIFFSFFKIFTYLIFYFFFFLAIKCYSVEKQAHNMCIKYHPRTENGGKETTWLNVITGLLRSLVSDISDLA